MLQMRNKNFSNIVILLVPVKSEDWIFDYPHHWTGPLKKLFDAANSVTYIWVLKCRKMSKLGTLATACLQQYRAV